MADMIYDGQRLKWGERSYRATSGLTWQYYYSNNSGYAVTAPMPAYNPLCTDLGTACAMRYTRDERNGNLIKGSGVAIPSRQLPKYQNLRDAPIPEGLWKIARLKGEMAEDDGTGSCNLKPSWRLEKIPRGEKATINNGSIDCERFWINWGKNRIRLEPANAITKQRLKEFGGRGGFYIHDSTKGYSHGCIETETRFFDDLYEKYGKNGLKNSMLLRVNYVPNRWTYGGTKR